MDYLSNNFNQAVWPMKNKKKKPSQECLRRFKNQNNIAIYGADTTFTIL